jgi:hypothetical protein
MPPGLIAMDGWLPPAGTSGEYTGAAAEARIASAWAASDSNLLTLGIFNTLAGPGWSSRTPLPHVVTGTAMGPGEVSDALDFIGEPDRIRTCDPLIKSQLLYLLSYGPHREPR